MAFPENDKARFNIRAAGVVIHNGRVLLDRNLRNTYWVFPGGHPEMMEPMTETVRREVKEEIGADIKVGRLLWILENFFHRKVDYHELSFYFLMQPPDGSPLLASNGPFYGDEQGQSLIYQWFPIEKSSLLALPLYPSVLVDALFDIPDAPRHLIFHDVKKASEERLTIQ